MIIYNNNIYNILDLRSLRSLRFPGSGFSVLRPQISFLEYIDLDMYIYWTLDGGLKPPISLACPR